MIIFSCLIRTVSMHFNGLFDCSKGHFNRVTEGSCEVTSRSLLYLKRKYRIDVKGGGRRSVLCINLTLGVNKSIIRRPLIE